MSPRLADLRRTLPLRSARPQGASDPVVSQQLLLVMGIAMIGAPTASAAPDEISCIDWFFSGGHQDHIHVELYLMDGTGRPVVGATVRFTTSYDTHDGNPPVVYATNTGDTRDKPGKNRGKGCPGGTAPRSGSTGFFCCAGAAMWSGETPPGKRACPAGLYTVNG